MRLLEHGAINAFLLFISKQNDQKLKEVGLDLLDVCIMEPTGLDLIQIPPLAHLLTEPLKNPVYEKSFIKKCIKLASKCCELESFCDSYLKYMSQRDMSRLMDQLDQEVKHQFIVLLITIFSLESRLNLIQPAFSLGVMTCFSKTIHKDTSKLWLKLLVHLVKDRMFAREFMRFGGLKYLLTLLRIPHLDIVFQSIRILKILAEKELVTAAKYGNATRQQLIHLLGGKIEVKIAKKQVSKIVQIPLVTKKEPESKGVMLLKIEKAAEERKRKEEEGLKKKVAAQPKPTAPSKPSKSTPPSLVEKKKKVVSPIPPLPKVEQNVTKLATPPSKKLLPREKRMVQLPVTKADSFSSIPIKDENPEELRNIQERLKEIIELLELGEGESTLTSLKSLQKLIIQRCNYEFDQDSHSCRFTRTYCRINFKSHVALLPKQKPKHCRALLYFILSFIMPEIRD